MAQRKVAERLGARLVGRVMLPISAQQEFDADRQFLEDSEKAEQSAFNAANSKRSPRL